MIFLTKKEGPVRLAVTFACTCNQNLSTSHWLVVTMRTRQHQQMDNAFSMHAFTPRLRGAGNLRAATSTRTYAKLKKISTRNNIIRRQWKSLKNISNQNGTIASWRPRICTRNIDGILMALLTLLRRDRRRKNDQTIARRRVCYRKQGHRSSWVRTGSTSSCSRWRRPTRPLRPCRTRRPPAWAPAQSQNTMFIEFCNYMQLFNRLFMKKVQF